MTDQVRLVTVAEFDALLTRAENSGRRLQLINGEIVEDMPKLAHARISVRLIMILVKYFAEHPIGEVFNELRVDLPDAEWDVRIPDISAVIQRQDELARLQGHESLPFMPDLVIEIQSEEQTDRTMGDLALYYFAHGCRMVWLVYPDRQLVEWLTPTERRILTIDETISGEPVLPGLLIPMPTIFERS